MAVTSIPKSANFVLEVRKGEDKNGNPTFSQKSFSGVKFDATDENILAVANAVGAVLASETGNCFVNKKTSLMETK